MGWLSDLVTALRCKNCQSSASEWVRGWGWGWRRANIIIPKLKYRYCSSRKIHLDGAVLRVWDVEHKNSVILCITNLLLVSQLTLNNEHTSPHTEQAWAKFACYDMSDDVKRRNDELISSWMEQLQWFEWVGHWYRLLSLGRNSWELETDSVFVRQSEVRQETHSTSLSGNLSSQTGGEMCPMATQNDSLLLRRLVMRGLNTQSTPPSSSHTNEQGQRDFFTSGYKEILFRLSRQSNRLMWYTTDSADNSLRSAGQPVEKWNMKLFTASNSFLGPAPCLLGTEYAM